MCFLSGFICDQIDTRAITNASFPSFSCSFFNFRFQDLFFPGQQNTSQACNVVFLPRVNLSGQSCLPETTQLHRSAYPTVSFSTSKLHGRKPQRCEWIMFGAKNTKTGTKNQTASRPGSFSQASLLDFCWVSIWNSRRSLKITLKSQAKEQQTGRQQPAPLNQSLLTTSCLPNSCFRWWQCRRNAGEPSHVEVERTAGASRTRRASRAETVTMKTSAWGCRGWARHSGARGYAFLQVRPTGSS